MEDHPNSITCRRRLRRSNVGDYSRFFCDAVLKSLKKSGVDGDRLRTVNRDCKLSLFLAKYANEVLYYHPDEELYAVELFAEPACQLTVEEKADMMTAPRLRSLATPLLQDRIVYLWNTMAAHAGYVPMHVEVLPHEFFSDRQLALYATSGRGRGDVVSEMFRRACANEMVPFASTTTSTTTSYDERMRGAGVQAELARIRAEQVERRRAKMHAFLLGCHGRVGVASAVDYLCDDVLELVGKFLIDSSDVRDDVDKFRETKNCGSVECSCYNHDFDYLRDCRAQKLTDSFFWQTLGGVSISKKKRKRT
jgi:hypothetical protein